MIVSKKHVANIKKDFVMLIYLWLPSHLSWFYDAVIPDHNAIGDLFMHFIYKICNPSHQFIKIRHFSLKIQQVSIKLIIFANFH
jgi:hypothetical protein